MRSFFKCRFGRALYLALILCSIYLYLPQVSFGSVSAYTPVSFIAGSPKLVLRPFNIAPGKTDQVTGINFTPLSTVEVTFAGSGNSVATAQANSTGGFKAKFIVSSNTPQGLYLVSASDNSSGKLTAQNILSVVNTPKIVLSTGGKAHIVGVSVSVNGSGFSANNHVTVYFNNVAVAASSTDSVGSFLTSFEVPAEPEGTYYVNATDGTYSTFKTFVLNPHITISPNSMVAVGSRVTVSGSGYSPGSSISFTFSGKVISTKVMTNILGEFSAQVTIPSVVKGSYQLAASDQQGYTSTGRVGVSN